MGQHELTWFGNAMPMKSILVMKNCRLQDESDNAIKIKTRDTTNLIPTFISMFCDEIFVSMIFCNF